MTRTIYRTGTALTLLMLPALALATAKFDRRLQWNRQNVGHSVALASNGGYLVGGETWVDTTLYGIVLARTDSLGDTAWVRQLLNVDHGSGYACALLGGGFVVSGTRNNTHVFARGFTPSGDSAWSYGPSIRGRVDALIGTSDGGCLIAGRDSMLYMGLVKLDSVGHGEWNHGYGDPRIQGSTANGVAETWDGGFILCGNATDYMGSYVRLVRTDSIGDTLWTQLFSGPVGPSLQAVCVTPDRGFLTVGSEFDTLLSHDELYLMRTDSNGALAWTRGISLPGAGTQATALCATRDGGYMIAGTIDWTDSARAWLVKLDAAADTVWTSVLPGIGKEQAGAVWQTPDGGYVVAGTSDSAGGSVLLIKTDSLGFAPYGVAEEKSVFPERVALSVEPNPASDVVKVEWSLPAQSAANVSVYDVTGKQVYSSFGLLTSSFRLGLRSIPAGVYLLRLESSHGSATRKLVIE